MSFWGDQWPDSSRLAALISAARQREPGLGINSHIKL
jgi:hypothetical protein